MDTFTIAAVTEARARALYEALARFKTELVESEDGRQQVVVTLGPGDREIIEVLNTIQDHVTARSADGPARIEFHDRVYTLHPG